MRKSILVGVFMFNVIFVCSKTMMGPGIWKVYHLSYKECDINDIITDLQQKMLNRTHYVYSGKIIARVPLDDGLAVKVDICQYVDGGCKPYQVITDSSYMAFMEKYAEVNINTALAQMGVDPPCLPLAPGEYKVENFMFNAAELPESWTYGRYIGEMCAIKLGVPVGCVVCECEFFEPEETDEEDE